MAAGSTYTPITTTTVGTATTSVTFNSFSGYTDLVVVYNVRCSFATPNTLGCRINGDSGTNYSTTQVSGSGSVITSERNSNETAFYSSNVAGTGSSYTPGVINFMNYANTSTYKTMLMEGGSNLANTIQFGTSLWRSNSAITSLNFFIFNGTNIEAGSSFTLYGIAAA
jgi:hypothetical protein